jgi:hypothetical protein
MEEITSRLLQNKWDEEDKEGGKNPFLNYVARCLSRSLKGTIYVKKVLSSQIAKDVVGNVKSMITSNISAILARIISKSLKDEKSLSGISEGTIRFVSQLIAKDILGKKGTFAEEDDEEYFEDDEEKLEDSDTKTFKDKLETYFDNKIKKKKTKENTTDKSIVMGWVSSYEEPEKRWDKWMPQNLKEILGFNHTGYKSKLSAVVTNDYFKIAQVIKESNEPEFRQLLFPSANVQASYILLTPCILSAMITEFVHEKGKGAELTEKGKEIIESLNKAIETEGLKIILFKK